VACEVKAEKYYKNPEKATGMHMKFILGQLIQAKHDKTFKGS